MTLTRSQSTWFERLGTRKAAELRALLRGEGGTVLFEHLGEVTTRLAPEKEKDGRRRFQMLAYTGKRIVRWFGDMVVDLSGIDRDTRTPMLLEHMDCWPVAVAEEGGLAEKGYALSGYMLQNSENTEARKLIANMDEGVPYRASVGIRFVEVSELDTGAEAEVNGEKHRGPLTIVRRCLLFETSFLLNPADLDTEVQIMSAQTPRPTKDGSVADLSETAPETMARLRAEQLASLRQEERERADALTAAFSKRPKFVAKMIAAGKTVEQAKLADYESRAKKIAKLELELAAKKAGEKTITQLKADARYAGLGFDARRNDSGSGSDNDKLAGLPLEERCRVQLGNDWRLQQIFGRFENRGGTKVDPVKAFMAAELYSEKLRYNGMPLVSPSNIARHADLLREICDPVHGPVNRELLLGPQGERLGIGKGAPDYSVITVKGFQGLFYPRFEDEISGLWSKSIAFQSESNQETEIHRWLGMFPQMTLWGNERQTTPMLNYQQIITSSLYQAAIEVDKNDFRLQKFGLISQRIGEGGAVAAEHWNLLSTNVLEANPVCYDGSQLYSRTHALGGAAPAAQVNAFTAADNGAFNPGDPTNPSVGECVAIILALITPMYGFKFSNNTPANGGARQFVIVVPFNMMANMGAAITVDKLDYGQDNPLKKQPFTVQVMVNPRATQTNVVRCFRTDCMNRALIMQEPGAPELLFQGPGSYLEWFKHSYGYAVESSRAVGAGDWLSTTQATLGN